jgi:GxxExxY protein
MERQEESKLLCGQITDRVISVFYGVYNELGHGFLEAIYQSAMAMALKAVGLTVAAEVKYLSAFAASR